MMTTVVIFASLLASVRGLPTADGGDAVPSYMPPVAGDVRSPCPLLNSLANEGILPRSGKGYTIPILEAGFKYVNVGADVAQVVGGAGIALSPKKDSDSFDLNNLDKHNAIEHDGSISRNDHYFGNDHSFDPILFSEAAAFFQGPTIDIQNAADARFTRQSTSKRINPDYSLPKNLFDASFTEQSFYLSVFGNPYTGIVPNSEWVRYWFEEQRLPYPLGWTPRKEETNLTTLAVMAKKVMKATPSSSFPEGYVYHFVPH